MTEILSVSPRRSQKATFKTSSSRHTASPFGASPPARRISSPPMRRSSSPVRRSSSPPQSGGLKRQTSFLRSSGSSFFLRDMGEEDAVHSSTSDDHEQEPSALDFMQDSDYSERSHSTVPTSISSFERRQSRDSEDNFFPSYDNDFTLPPVRYEYMDEFKMIESPESSEDPYDASQSDTSEAESDHSPDVIPVVDDIALKPEPSRHVDYLSHKWNEEEVAASWKHIVSQRRAHGERSRLENASWRSWAKTRSHLKTVSPGSINWFKESDTTWLYGPVQELQQQHKALFQQKVEEKVEAALHEARTQRPILKTRTPSERMLRVSLSSSSLIKQATAAVQAERDLIFRRKPSRPRVARAQSDFGYQGPTLEIPTTFSPLASSSSATSIGASPLVAPKRHIHFNETVQQAQIIAMGEEEIPAWQLMDDLSSDEEELIMAPKKRNTKRPASKRNDSKASTSSVDTVCITPLPSTSIKFHCDRKRCVGDHESWLAPSSSISHSRRPFKMTSSASQETLRPSHPSSNYLLQHGEDDEDDDDGRLTHEIEVRKDPTASSATFQFRADDRAMVGYGPGQARELLMEVEDTTAAEFFEEPVARAVSPALQFGFSTGGVGGLKRTQSGLFMPFALAEDDEEEAEDDQKNEDEMVRRERRGSWLGQVMDTTVNTVNTVSDIAQVIWNVGWNR